MYDAEAIAGHLGAEAAKYVANKNRGGRNNANGATYESYYAAAQIAAELAEALRTGDDGTHTWLQEQQLCFIDDLIIERLAGRRLSQLKSGKSTAWTGGDHPIQDDFRMQRRLDEALGVSAEYELVVSDTAVQADLQKAKPHDIDAQVVHFSREADLDRLFAEHPDVVEALDEISTFEPRPSVRRQVFTTLLGAWVTSGSRISLAEFAERAASGPGPLVAVPGPEYVLPAPVEENLRRIAGLDFAIRKKHLYCRFGSLEGLSAFRGGSPECAAFERYIVESRPTDPYEVMAALRGGA